MTPGDDPWRGANDEAGIADLVGRLQALVPHLIVLEAPGGVERLVVAALALAGLPVAVVNPRQGRDARPGHRPVGQDRRLGCRRAGALRRGDPPGPAARARCREPGARRVGGATSPARGPADRRDAPLPIGSAAGPA